MELWKSKKWGFDFPEEVVLELSRSLLGKERRGECSRQRKEHVQRPCEYENLEEEQSECSRESKKVVG